MAILVVLRKATILFILSACFGIAIPEESCRDFIVRKIIGNTNIESRENYSLDLEAKVVGKDIYDVTFKCQNDFLLQGPNQVHCFQNGSWSREIPKCLEQCANLIKIIENIQVSTTNRTINSTVELSCKLPKYEFEGPKRLYCKHGGWWADKHKLERADYPSCRYVACEHFISRIKSIGYTNIESIENYVLDLEATIVGKQTYDVTFFCRNDFLLQGPNQARCFPNGSWSREIPKCVEQCANLINLENIQVSTNKRTINSTVELSCKLTKNEFKGPQKLHCKHGGWWTDKHKLERADYPSCEACGEFIVRKKTIGNSNIESKEKYLDLEAKVVGKDTYDVIFKCRKDFLLQGPDQARCLPNGSWSREIPKCLEQCADLLVKIDNIQVSTTKRTINSTVELSCKLPKYEVKGPKQLYCKHGGWWSEKKKLYSTDYPSCKVKPTYTSWKVYLIVTGAILILITFLAVYIWTRRKHGKDIDGEVKAHPELLKSLFCVKVWSADREKRKVIVTEDYKSLRNSVCLEFNINGRLVLEEDGTEIENDESLLRYKDKTLMVLAKNEQWKNSRSRQYNSSQSAKFHVFSNNRQKSVMISLEDLGEQALHMLGYKPQQICLETDGTYLESERDLKVFTGHRLMAVKKGCTWTVPQDGDFPHSSHYSANQERHMFVVRSLDGQKRKEIFASNVDGLHFAAATALRLHPPVEVTTNNGLLISDDLTLSQHVNDVLTVTEVRRSRKLLLQNDTPRSTSVYSA